jgi:L-ascorbate metabolism protein UlaG (beta-lactamase superfamily)
MRLTWHGHSTWRVDVGETTLLVDPFFDNPKTSLSPEDVAPDYVLLTHGHADHIADVGAYPDATVVGVPELVAWVEDEHGHGEIVGTISGGTVECGDAFVTMHPAQHTNGINTTYEYEAGVPAGYLVSTAPPTRTTDEETESFYHAGDTSLTTELRDVVGSFLEPDAAAVPVGDHFTMGPEQAAVAVDWLGVDHAFPMHYDTFPPIEVDTGLWEREVRATGSDAETHVLAGDESFDLTER